MAKNTMQDLRNHLFETLEALKDEEKPMDIERAKAVCQISQQLIESAKTEVKFMEVTGNTVDGNFFDRATARPQLTTGKAI
jgi:hypothetical protein